MILIIFAGGYKITGLTHHTGKVITNVVYFRLACSFGVGTENARGSQDGAMKDEALHFAPS